MHQSADNRQYVEPGFILQVLLTLSPANISVANLSASLPAKLHWPL